MTSNIQSDMMNGFFGRTRRKGQFFIISAVIILLVLYSITQTLNSNWKSDVSEVQGNDANEVLNNIANGINKTIAVSDESHLEENLNILMLSERSAIGDGYTWGYYFNITYPNVTANITISSSKLYVNKKIQFTTSPNLPCSDTCGSIGYQCGTQTVCGVSTNCGICAAPNICDVSGVCVPPLALNAIISAPTTASVFRLGETINFVSSVNGGTPPYTYDWKYRRMGEPFPIDMGNTNTLIKDDFASGSYEITLTVTDNVGTTITTNPGTMITITDPLTVSISTPIDDGTFEALDTISFNMIEADGSPPYTYIWASNIDGNFGNTNIINIYDLSAGIHTITATVTDSLGDAVTDSITITINTPPALKARITSPIDKEIFGEGETTVLDSLVAGGNPPYTYSWDSNIDGNLGNSQSLNSVLNFGNHTITLTVTDALSATYVAKVTSSIVRCVTIINNGDPENKLDIVYLQDKYTNLAQFAIDANSAYSGIVAYEPFTSNQSKINVHRVEGFVDIGCASNVCPPGNCDAGIETKLASYCNADEIIVIIKNDALYRGCAYLCGTAYISSKSAGFPADGSSAHEFGHTFGCLPDYVSLDPTCSIYKTIMNSACNGYGFTVEPGLYDTYGPLETKLNQYT